MTAIAAVMLAGCSGGGSTPPLAPGEPDAAVDAGPEVVSDSAPGNDAPVDGELPDAPPITGAALQVNDVSILWPLPSTLAERDALLAATSSGPRGEVFPAAVYASVGGMLAFGGQVAHSELRVIAARIDPCFAQTSPPLDGAGCQPQLRLILQPIQTSPGAGGVLEASDAAVHTFHAITRAEVFALAQALVALRLASTMGEALGPLAPHPLIVREGVTGAYASGVRELVQAHAGASNLTRVAIMSSTSSQAWSFQIFDVEDAVAGTVVARDIATLPAATQQHDLLIFEGGGGLFVGFTPEPAEAFNDLASSNRAAEIGQVEREAQFDRLVATENPRLTTPETTSCGSCHVATLVREQIAGPAFGLEASASANVFLPDERFVAAADLRATPPGTNFNIHAFSYNGRDPAISARTAHESAAVIEYFRLVAGAEPAVDAGGCSAGGGAGLGLAFGLLGLTIRCRP